MDNYRVVGAFDTETTNYGDVLSGLVAFPILYQFGLFNCDVTEITPDNVKELVNISLFRRAPEFYNYLDEYLSKPRSYTPVIMVHNLGFDMYSLAPWLLKRDVKVLAKTAKKPISFQVLDENKKPLLVFLDTLGMFMKSLATLGEECGTYKLVGSWNYSNIRTPDTPLTSEEVSYSQGDIYTLCAYMGYFLRQNPDIKQSDIGFRIQTKTGIVRAKRMVHIGNLKSAKQKLKVRQYWHLQNKSQKPKSDNELFTMHAATRGGFTFCARNNASKVFFADDNYALESYDATSQHPAQMISHLYPIDFQEASKEQLGIAFNICVNCSINHVLEKWAKPFPYAFYASFVFENLRPKTNTIFKREGIFSCASARINSQFDLYDNQANTEFKNTIALQGFKDSAVGAVCSFGKLESAKHCTLYLTELEAWIMSRIYEWDNVEAISGYITSTYRKASDMSVLSVMRFYKAKNALKEFKNNYHFGVENDASILDSLYPSSFINDCAQGRASSEEIKEYYMLSKADLNALFGIEATNECRREYELNEHNGIHLIGNDGLQNMPKSPKCNYQYGQRIVGWSRVAQVCIIELLAPHIENIICGDTDSIKIYYSRKNIKKINKALSAYNKAVDKAKKSCLRRVKTCFKAQYDDLCDIGHYVFDGEYKAFSASWNKCYIALTDKGCKATIAGIPTSRRVDGNNCFNDFCNVLMDSGLTFGEVAQLVTGYNVTIDFSITKLNARYHPKFGDWVNMPVTDYNGVTTNVCAPAALALFPSIKTIGDTTNKENLQNSIIALKNNPQVNITPVWLKWRDGKAIIER